MSKKRETAFRDYVNEEALRAELTLVNLKEEYKKSNQSSTIEKFNKRKNDRIEEIKEYISTNEEISLKEKEFLESEIIRLSELTIEKQNKELMGHYVLLITKNLAKKSCFAGYTLNWKDEFFSRAIEHCFKYIHNFDEDKVSERSGKKVKAFAYLTQIIYTSFLDVISKRKKEQEKLKMMGSISDVTRAENNYNVSIEKKSKYKDSIQIELDVLNEDDLNEEFDSLMRFKEVRDKMSTLKSEVFLLSEYKGLKDEDFIESEKRIFKEYDELNDEMMRFKMKYKTTVKPKVILITCNDYGDIKLGEVLNKFQVDGMSCVITKNKTPKKIEKNSISDF